MRREQLFGGARAGAFALGREHHGPVEAPGLHVVMAVAHHLEELAVGIQDAALPLPHEDADEARFEQPLEPFLACPACLIRQLLGGDVLDVGAGAHHLHAVVDREVPRPGELAPGRRPWRLPLHFEVRERLARRDDVLEALDDGIPPLARWENLGHGPAQVRFDGNPVHLGQNLIEAQKAELPVEKDDSGGHAHQHVELRCRQVAPGGRLL